MLINQLLILAINYVNELEVGWLIGDGMLSDGDYCVHYVDDLHLLIWKLVIDCEMAAMKFLSSCGCRCICVDCVGEGGAPW